MTWVFQNKFKSNQIKSKNKGRNKGKIKRKMECVSCSFSFVQFLFWNLQVSFEINKKIQNERQKQQNGSKMNGKTCEVKTIFFTLSWKINHKTKSKQRLYNYIVYNRRYR